MDQESRRQETERSKQSSISVAVRVRPFTSAEENYLIKPEEGAVFLGDGSLSNHGNNNQAHKMSTPRGIHKLVDVMDDKMLIFDPSDTNPLSRMQRNAFPNSRFPSRIREHRFVFDKLFDVSASQEDVYNETTRPLLDSVLDGYNATVFAYGATGCGKTHTISGSPSDPGVIFLTMKELYEKIEKISDTKTIDINLSFLEIYNETIRDLLNPETDFKKLLLREDAYNKMSVSNLSCHQPKSVEEVMDLIFTGNNNRTCSPTEANATSSRSHAVLQINIAQRNRTAEISEEHTFATLSIIDLAGSERAAATKNRGARLNEGANINKSLLALGNCINALCDPRRRNHIPYRDSKLTRLLKFSLGGNCKTVMIVCISPSSDHYDETLNTLKYADRAKEIKTKLVRNQRNLDRHVGSYLKMITEQKQEIDDLRSREMRVVEEKMKEINVTNEKCVQLITENIESLKASLEKQMQEKWKKYFILAKRKLLLSLKAETGCILQVINQKYHKEREQHIVNIVNLLEQLLSKLESQISDLESSYSRPSDLDYISNESTKHAMRKLKETEGWTKSHTKLFEINVAFLKDSLERDILFNSSILYDYLVYELGGQNFLSRTFTDILAYSGFSEKENFESSRFDELYNDVAVSLEYMVTSEYDFAIESSATEFMQRKTKEQEDLNSKQFADNKKAPGNVSFKRVNRSPMKASPPRTFKKSLTRKPQPVKASNQKARASKKVRWDVPQPNSFNGDSDLSFDETTSQNNTIIKSDMEDDSPEGNRVLDRSLLSDDLDFKFDSPLESPPLSLGEHKNFNEKIMADVNRKRTSNTLKPRLAFTNKRLSVNLSQQNSDVSKLPLLNKGASTKVVSSPPKFGDNYDRSLRSMIPTPSPQKPRLSSFGKPTHIMSRIDHMDESMRSVSSDSDKVD